MAEINEEIALRFVAALVEGLRANGLSIQVSETSAPEVLAHSESTDGEELPGDTCGIKLAN
jgi:hypothetical protein